jgi:hypothetical protein
MNDLAHVSGGTFGGRRSKQFAMFLTHKQPLLKTGQVGERPDSARIQPSGVRVVRVRKKELLALDRVPEDGVLAFRRD